MRKIAITLPEFFEGEHLNLISYSVVVPHKRDYILLYGTYVCQCFFEKTSIFVEKLLTFTYNEYILIRFRFSKIYLGGLG